jgi:ATP-dependent Clp protease ATP-binding subunit ClpC
MFERFSERARRILFFARYELSTLGGQAIDPAHILLGMLRDQRMQGLFANWNVPLADVRVHIERHIPRGPKSPTSVEVPFAEATKRMLNGAAAEASRLRSYRVEPEHLLLALLHESDRLGAATLESHGMTLDSAREYVVSQPPVEEARSDLAPGNPFAQAHAERIMELVRALAQTPPDRPEGQAIVERIEDELKQWLQ